MIVTDKKIFGLGMLLTFSFFTVLAVMFSPIFDGRNAFNASDDLFNSIAKGSSNYLEGLREEGKQFQGSAIDMTLKMKSPELAENGRLVVTAIGFQASAQAESLTLSGDLGTLISAALEDAEAMFNNDGAKVKARYQLDEKEAIYAQWSVLKSLRKGLEDASRFKEAKYVEEVALRGVEVGYNFYGIEPRSAASYWMILAGALLFYVVYTLWWGYAILFLFDGLGLQMKKGKKKEV